MNGSPETAHFVVCVRNDGYQASLELHKIYRQVHDPEAEARDEIRVIDESGEDYLYPASNFTPIQPSAELARALLNAS